MKKENKNFSIALPHYTEQTFVKDKIMISKKSAFDLTIHKNTAGETLKTEIKYGNIRSHLFSTQKKQMVFFF